MCQKRFRLSILTGCHCQTCHYLVLQWRQGPNHGVSRTISPVSVNVNILPSVLVSNQKAACRKLQCARFVVQKIYENAVKHRSLLIVVYYKTLIKKNKQTLRYLQGTYVIKCTYMYAKTATLASVTVYIMKTPTQNTSDMKVSYNCSQMLFHQGRFLYNFMLLYNFHLIKFHLIKTYKQHSTDSAQFGRHSE